MFTKRFLTVFAVMIFLLPGTIAYAHGRNKDAAAFFFLKKSAVDLPQIIEGVEKEEKGRVIFFKIEEEEHGIQYEMKILKKKKVFEAKVDPKSGKVLKTESAGFFSQFSDDEEKIPTTAKLSLKEAVSIVEKHYGGKVLRGAVQKNPNVQMYRIRVANNEGACTVMVDADTGELFRLPDKEARKDHDEGEGE